MTFVVWLLLAQQSYGGDHIMAISTFEGVVENGQIRLQDDIKLPEQARVFVVVPDFETVSRTHVYSPRLVHPEQAAVFVKQIVEVDADAEL